MRDFKHSKINPTRKAQWIMLNSYEQWVGKKRKCSRCNGESIIDYPFCPWCGKKIHSREKPL